MSLKGAIYYGEITDGEILGSIGSDINSLCKNNNQHFSPTWAYIVTWYECAPYTFGTYNTQRNSNTFQMLLTSNGNDSFAILNYISMNWPNNNFKKSFTSGYSLRSYNLNVNRIIENVTVSNLIDKSNMERPGRWFINFNNTNCRFY